MRATPIAALMLLLFRLPAIAQQPPANPKASLEGVVVRAGTGEPLAGARAILTVAATASATDATSQTVVASVGAAPTDLAIIAASVSTPGAARPAAAAIEPETTNWDGKFVFQNLDPGLYRLQIY